jgi:starch-binding outer membrane protein, SusD/RagB family
MKKYISKLIKISLILFVVSSCEHEDFFELTNPPEFPWLNITEFERAAVSPYNYAFFTGWGGSFFMTDRVIVDAMTDLIYHIPGSSANYPVTEVYYRQTNVELDRVNESFTAGYRAIGLINSALDFYFDQDENPYPRANANDIEHNLKRIIGELHFMRAYSYFHHTLRHCPAPGNPDFETEKILPLHENFTDIESALNANFVSTREIYNFIVDDLIKSIELLPEYFAEGLHHPSYRHGRANRFSARSILARVYFRLGLWEDALEQLDLIIDNNKGRFNLDQEPFDAFNRSDASRGNEVIWQAIYYDNEKGMTPKDATMFTWLDYRARNGGKGRDFRRCTWHTYAMSHSVARQIGWMDDSLNETDQARRDKRYRQLFHRIEGNRGIIDDDPEIYEQQYTHVKEPRIWNDKYYRGPDGQYTNVPVIRLAEMYLTRAIIRMEQGNRKGAADDLNMVRGRAWDANIAGVSYDNSDAFVTEGSITPEMVHIERIRELAFEGDHLYYIQALKLPVPPGDRQDVTEIPFPYSGLYWPIPQSELDFKLD